MEYESKIPQELVDECEELRRGHAKLNEKCTDFECLLRGLTQLIGCFSEMEPDPVVNIGHLTALCGEHLSARFALYHHLDGAKASLWSMWNTPPDFDEVGSSSVCRDVAGQASSQISVIRNLKETDYAQTDPDILRHELQTYVGRTVREGQTVVGLLSLYFQHDFELKERDKKLLEAVALMAAAEEKRSRSETALLLENYSVSEVLSASPLAISYFQKGRLRWANKAMLELFREYVEAECLGKSPRDFYPSDDEYDRVRTIIYQNLAAGRLAEADAKFKRKDGSLFDGHIMAGSPDPSNPRMGTIMTISDITAKKLAEEALHRSEENYKLLYEESNRAQELYRSLLNSCADAIVIYDMEGRAQYISDSFTHTFGWTKKDVIGKQIPFVPESERELTMTQVYNLLSGRVARGAFETKRYRKDGRVLDVRVSASRYHDLEGKPAGMLVILSDITENKRAEVALAQSEARLRMLSAQLLTAQENERKRVSRELHDGIGQSLTALRFKLEAAFPQRHSYEREPGHEGLASLLFAIRGLIEEVHRISMDLRPSMLDDLGILATITWLLREFQTACSNIDIEKTIRLEEREVPEPLKTVIFRVLQEAFNNIAKHSRAQHVQIYLGRTDGGIELIVLDDGVGFDMNDALHPGEARRGLGIASIRERIELSGGSFHLRSARGDGTTIRALWPEKDSISILR